MSSLKLCLGKPETADKTLSGSLCFTAAASGRARTRVHMSINEQTRGQCVILKDHRATEIVGGQGF